LLSKWLQKATKEAKEGREVKKAITIEKKEILQKYESGVRVTDLANTYSMSKSTFFIIKRSALWGSERIMGISIISYRKNSLYLRPT
jgi:transposase-like protein